MLALAGGSPPLHARALTTLGWIALFEGDTQAAKDAAERAVAAAAGESWILANALNLLGSTELARGLSEASGQRFEEALTLIEGDVEAGVWAPPILMNLGRLAAARGDVGEARRRYEAALAALPAESATFIRPMALGNLASLAWDEGDRGRAARLQREALPLRHELWDVLALANSLDNGAKFAVAGGRPAMAARLLGAAAAVRRRGNVTIELFNLDDHHALLAQVREQLDGPAFTAAWAHGESLSLEQAMADADAVLAAAAQDDHGTVTVTDGSVS
jgi:tetratricopeptide (TPR) repeat protein